MLCCELLIHVFLAVCVHSTAHREGYKERKRGRAGGKGRERGRKEAEKKKKKKKSFFFRFKRPAAVLILSGKGIRRSQCARLLKNKLIA